MPTGYTHDVQKGRVTDFPTFALQCARAFGALILMRDDPVDAPIPAEFQPSEYEAKALADAQANLDRLRRMTPADADAAAASAYAEAWLSWQRRGVERREQRARYEAMLAQVRAWEPPSVDHVEMKAFMENQLLESIDFDCSGKYDDPPVALSGKDWHEREQARLMRSVARYAEQHAKEVERTKGRNVWVQKLRDSLEAFAVAQGAAK